MKLSFSSLNPKQQLRYVELIYLFILAVLIPFCIGLQIFDKFSHTLSLILLNITQLPSIVFFYRVYLEKMVLKGKTLLSFVVFPVFFLMYELNCRISALLMIRLPFIPQDYRNKLISGHPEDFSQLNQSIGYTCLILLTAFALTMTRRLLKKQAELHDLQFDKVKLELEHLKSQLQPHFFFNTLNNLYTLSLQQSEKAPKIIASLSSIMRYVLYESKEEKVALSREIRFMENYFELERIRHTDPNQIEFVVQGNPDGIEIEPLLFLPLIENCFKHALQQDVLENPVKIVLVIDSDELVFQTSNKLIDKVKTADFGGIGLSNVKKRLQLLYGNRQQLNLETESDHFIATISLQI